MGVTMEGSDVEQPQNKARKWQRALLKKLRQIEELKAREELSMSQQQPTCGAPPPLDAQQRQKLHGEAALRQQLREAAVTTKQMQQVEQLARREAASKWNHQQEERRQRQQNQQQQRQGTSVSVGSEAEVRRQISYARSPSHLLRYLHPRLTRVTPDCLCHGVHTLAKKWLQQQQEQLHEPQQEQQYLLDGAGVDLVRRLTQEAAALKGRQISKSMWAVTRLLQMQQQTAAEGEVALAGGFANSCIALVQALQLTMVSLFESASDGSIDAVTYATSTLNMDAQGVATTLWSMATQSTLPAALSLSSLQRHCLALLERHVLHFLKITEKCKQNDEIKKRSGMNAQDIANSIWAFAKLRWSLHARDAFAEALNKSLVVISKEIKSKEVSMLLWGLATLGEVPNAMALKALCKSVQQNVHAMNPQGVANILWALAKLQQHAEFQDKDAKEVVQVVFSLQARASSMFERMTPQGVANTIWAIAQLSDLCRAETTEVPPVNLDSILQNEAVLQQLSPQDTGDVAWALGKLAKTSGSKRTPSEDGLGTTTVGNAALEKVLMRCGELLPAMDWQGLGHVEFALFQLYGKHEPQAKTITATTGKTCRTLTLPVGLDPSQETKETKATTEVDRFCLPSFWNKLCGACKVARQQLNAIPHERENAVANAVARVQHSYSTRGCQGQQRVLLLAERLCGDSLKVAAKSLFTRLLHDSQNVDTNEESLKGKLKPKSKHSSKEDGAINIDVHVWSRFCGAGVIGRTSRAAGVTGNYAGAVVYVSAHKGSIRSMLATLATVLDANAPVVVCGYRQECGEVRVVHKAVTPYLELLDRDKPIQRQKRELADANLENEAFALVCTVVDHHKQQQQDTASSLPLELTPSTVPKAVKLKWDVYPGLFAGGLLDIMSGYMLETLPHVPDNAKVLDYCCGSGVIAAALFLQNQQCESLTMHLLDADAYAMEAAQRNMQRVAKKMKRGQTCKYFLSDSWDVRAEAEKKVKYDWIVSNPPVHTGAADDWTVLSSLLSGARKRLKPSGIVWIVAQTYVPVACLALELAPSLHTSVFASNGRFTVWRLQRPPQYTTVPQTPSPSKNKNVKKDTSELAEAPTASTSKLKSSLTSTTHKRNASDSATKTKKNKKRKQ